MTVLTPESFDFGYTQSQLDDMVNDAPLTMLEFAQKSGMYARFYGVLTGADEGLPMLDDQGQPQKVNRWDRFVVTHCARKEFWSKAFAAIAEMEALVNHRLSAQYITELVPFPNSYVMQTDQPGVAKMNVKRQWTTYDEGVPINPASQTDVTMSQPHIGDTPSDPTWYATISSVENPNPNDVYFRRNGKGTIMSIHISDSNPVERSGANWLVPLDTRKTSYDPLNDQIDVQNRKFVIVDLPAPSPALPVGATLVPVYPGTHQIIPQAKPMRIINDGATWRFTLYLYTLVHPEFVGSTVDLIAGDFYKLFPTIDFAYWLEVADNAVLIYTFGQEEETFTSPALTIKLTNPEKGIFRVSYNDCEVTDPCAFDWCRGWKNYPTQIQLRFSYKVAPDALPPKLRAQIPDIKNAIMGRVAADLPFVDCGCEVTVGFIYDMKTTYTKSYIAMTGAVAENVEYGKVKGLIEYDRMLKKAKIFHRQTQPGLNLSDAGSYY